MDHSGLIRLRVLDGPYPDGSGEPSKVVEQNSGPYTVF